MSARTITEADAGCYADCSRGWKIGERIIEVARSLGWDPTKTDPDYWEGADPDEVEFSNLEHFEHYSEGAEAWLNIEQCPDNYYWGSAPCDDGSWGLWKRTNCAQCSNEFKAEDEEYWPYCERCAREIGGVAP